MGIRSILTGSGKKGLHHMATFKDDGFTARTLMALETALADRAALDADIAVMVAALAKEHSAASDSVARLVLP